jgi:hypothetical protein
MPDLSESHSPSGVALMGFGFVLACFGLVLEIIRRVPVHRHLVFFDGTATEPLLRTTCLATLAASPSLLLLDVLVACTHFPSCVRKRPVLP